MTVILHLDLDSFFASCEQVRNPELADAGVVVCIYSDRGGDSGAVSAADYTAREYGIRAGMPIRQAKNISGQQNEDIRFLAADKEYYKMMSERVVEIVRRQVDEVEVASIDEVYADVTGHSYEEAAAIGDRVKAAVAETVGVTISAGIGPNKLVAKIASDHDKPDGLTVVRPGRVEEFLADLPVDDLYGVGPKTAETLHDRGVETVDELRAVPVQTLIDLFGEAQGTRLYHTARGDGSTELEQSAPKQLSRITTLPADTADIGDLRPLIRELAQDVLERVEERGWRYGRVVAIMVTDDREQRTRSRTLKTPTDDVETLYRTVEELVQEFLADHSVAVRRIGVRAAGFSRGEQASLDAFAS